MKDVIMLDKSSLAEAFAIYNERVRENPEAYGEADSPDAHIRQADHLWGIIAEIRGL